MVYIIKAWLCDLHVFHWQSLEWIHQPTNSPNSIAHFPCWRASFLGRGGSVFASLGRLSSDFRMVPLKGSYVYIEFIKWRELGGLRWLLQTLLRNGSPHLYKQVIGWFRAKFGVISSLHFDDMRDDDPLTDLQLRASLTHSLTQPVNMRGFWDHLYILCQPVGIYRESKSVGTRKVHQSLRNHKEEDDRTAWAKKTL